MAFLDIVKRKPDKEEIVADSIFFLASAFLALLATFIFDVHQSFYPGHVLFDKFIFTSSEPYYIAFFAGGLVGFFVLKFPALAFYGEKIPIDKKSKQNKLTSLDH